MKNEKLSNFLGLCLIGAIAVAVAAFFVIKPSLVRSDVARVKVASTNNEITALHLLAIQTETLRQKYEDVKDRRDQILHQLPSKSEEERLLALLSALGQQSGVVVSSFVPAGSSPSAAASSISTYPASINVSGSYAQMQDYLRKIENGARFINVQSASFSTSNGGGLTGSITLQGYYQSLDAIVTSGRAK